MKFLNTTIQIIHNPKNIIPFNDTCSQDASTQIIPWIKFKNSWRPLYSDLSEFLLKCDEFKTDEELEKFILESTNYFEVDYQYMLLYGQEALIKTDKHISRLGQDKYNVDINDYEILSRNNGNFISEYSYLLLNIECNSQESVPVTFKIKI